MGLGLLVLLSWFAIAIALGRSGLFSQIPAFALFGVGMFLPPVLYWILWMRLAAFRRFVLSCPVRHLTLLQASRMTGVIFLFCYRSGILPGAFAIPTGISDIAIGISALIVAFKMRELRIWHLAGIA